MQRTHAPFRFNMAAIGILPAGIIKAATAEQQIDMLYDIADNSDRDSAKPLLTLASKMIAKING